MKNALLWFGLLALWASAAKAQTLVVVTNGAGIYYTAYAGMAFTDAKGDYVFIGGTQKFVEIFYPDGTYRTYPYDPAAHTFSGTDEIGSFTAIVHETLATVRRGGGGGRGNGYPGTRTVVTGGEIDYTYYLEPAMSDPDAPVF